MKGLIKWVKDKVTLQVRIGAGLLVLVILAVLIFMYVVSDQRNEGIMPSDKNPDTATNPQSEKFLDHNIIEIRNEVFVLNGQDVKIDDLRNVLQRLHSSKPDAVVELQWSDDRREPAGMVQTLKEAVEASRLKFQN